MDDVLLEKFLKGDPLLIRQLRPIILDYVAKTGGGPDDAREVFQIVSLALFERAKRSPERYAGKVFKTWLSKRRKDSAYVSDQVHRLEENLGDAFAGHPGLKAGIRKKDEAAVGFFLSEGRAVLLPFMESDGGNASDADAILGTALEKMQRVILDFKDYFLKSCKNEWLRLKKKRGMISSEEHITHTDTADDADMQHHEQSNLILNLLHKASDACRKLLHQLFIEGKTKEELLGLLGYSNPGSFDVAKSRCLSALRADVKQYPHFKLADA